MSVVKSLKIEAQRLFVSLAQQAGLQAENYACKAEWIKDDRNRLHIVQRYDQAGGASVVLKYAQRPVDQEEFSRILDAHHNAHAALTGSNTNIVPEILSEDRQAQAYLMRYVSGETFLERCRNQEDHTPFLRRAGSWMSAFHGETVQQKRAFQPRFMVNHMHKLAGQMKNGQRRISGQSEFIPYAENIGAHVGAAEGHIGTISAKHGDLNAHNILMSDDTTAVYDFLGADNAPVAYDIARFLQSYTQMVGELDDVPKGLAVPQRAWDAFFEGYTLVSADDPILVFLSKVQVLTDWNRMQDKNTLNGIIRLERVKKIARQAFA